MPYFFHLRQSVLTMIDLKKIPSPSYVLEVDKLEANLQKIAHVQKEAGVQIILALKGFSMWKMFPLVKQYLSGATASSAWEARLIAEEMGCKAHTYSPLYTEHGFKELVQNSSHLTFNSVYQAQQYATKAKSLSGKIELGLRVNPEYSTVETDLYNPASPTSRLGETTENLVDLPKGITGLHFHTLCESSAQDLERTLVAFEVNFGRFLPELKWVNFGGGHLMTREGYDIPRLIRVLQMFKRRHPHLEVIMEPGSAIAWDCGPLVSTVLDIHESGGVKTLMLDVSFTCHMPDTLEMPYRPKIIGASDPVSGKPTFRLGGMSCLAGDFLEEYSFDWDVQIGDHLVFRDMMHYTMVKTTTFNGVQLPSIGIWHEDQQEFELVRSFGYEDFKNRLG